MDGQTGERATAEERSEVGVSVPEAPCFLGKHGFEYDVFFSYAHGDVYGDGNSILKEWSHEFYEALRRQLGSYMMKPPPRIFFDQSKRDEDGLRRNAHLKGELARNVRSSALLQVVMSPQYLESMWCARELAAFVGEPANEAMAQRIIIAKALNTHKQDWPALLCDEDGNKDIGWLMHEPKKDFPYGWCGWPDARPGSPSKVPPGMREEFLRMASHIHGQLCKLNEEFTERANKEKLVRWFEKGKVDKIYLYGRDDEVDAWASTWKEIDDLGITVTPREPEPLDADDDSSKRIEYARLASTCDAMLMVGANGVKLDFDLDVVGHDRRQFIMSRFQKYLPCAIVARHSKLKCPERISYAKRYDIDWIEPGDCDWPDFVKTWLQESADKVRQRYGLPVQPPSLSEQQARPLEQPS